MKNIAIMVYSLSGGGSERAAATLSIHLSKQYNVFLFICDDNDITYEYAGRIVKVDEVGLYRAIRNNKIQYQIDCSISFGELMNFANIRTSLDETIIISHRNSTEISNDTLPMIKKYYPYADKIVACSYGVKDLLVRNAQIKESKVVPIYNFSPVYKPKTNSFKSELLDSFLNGSPYVINVGSLKWEKNQKSLIKQFSYFCKKYNGDMKLVIVGSGPLEKELSDEISKNHADNSIIILPFCKDLSMYLSKAEAFVFTSLVEGMPNVIVEAMVSELPVISTDCLSGPRELLNDEIDYSAQTNGYRIAKRGILVEQDTYNSEKPSHHFSDALLTFFSDENLRKKLRLNVVDYIEKYNDSLLTDQWIEVINTQPEQKKEVQKEIEKYDYLVDTASEIIIYGAGKYGKAILKAIGTNNNLVFAVSDDPCEDYFEGIPVKKLSKLAANKESAVIIIATISEKKGWEMINHAKYLGYKNIIYGMI